MYISATAQYITLTCALLQVQRSGAGLKESGRSRFDLVSWAKVTRLSCVTVWYTTLVNPKSALAVSPGVYKSGDTAPDAAFIDSAMPGTPVAALDVAKRVPAEGHESIICESGSEKSFLGFVPEALAT